MRRLGCSVPAARGHTRRACERQASTTAPSTSGGAGGSSSSSSTGRGATYSASAAEAEAPSTTAARRARAVAIQRRELVYRWLRRLVVPAFSAYGLFVVRPTEGHFLRYAAERRHLDPAFNVWFPPVAAASPEESAAAALPPASDTSAVAAAFRTERDRAWAAQRFNYTRGSEDEERVARKRLLFARDRVHQPDDTVVETIRSPSERIEDLRALQEHPPMHLLSEQLSNIAVVSHRYRAATAAAAEAAPPPPIEIHVEDRYFFATAAILFRDRDSRVVHTMRFIGACGMLWKEIA
ncbi:hypothetical protein NESM_000229200 [Novymonas esmeraldas]|uniref:Uncharacterized protein n=1 Tax=Novymonas esmeraldas TaxID=1808958 RepID=A0AAW0FA13_9TRYP